MNGSQLNAVLEVYRITLLSNRLTEIILRRFVLEVYRITLLSNEPVETGLTQAVLEVYRITLLSNTNFIGSYPD